MGYLDNSTVTVDAILTNKGRQILAAGGQLNITKFALSDDEIDYTLWNPSHTLGSNYYGAVIEAMPVVEANPDETQMMKYKLVTLPKDSPRLPVITVTPSAITLANINSSATINPNTAVDSNLNRTLGFTAILNDDSIAILEVAPNGFVQGSTGTTISSATTFLDDEVNGVATIGSSVSRIGTSFVVRPKATTTVKFALITIIGNETGGVTTISVRVDANTSALTPQVIS
jgi:hypothetical protein